MAAATRGTSAAPSEVLEFALDEARYAVPLERVVEVAPRVAIRHLPGAPEIVLGLIRYRGAAVVAVDLRSRLGHPQRAASLDDQLVIARTEHRRVALVVDRILGVRPIDPRKVSAPPIRAEHVRGVVEIEGALLLLHDLDAVLSLDEERAVQAALTQSEAAR